MAYLHSDDHGLSLEPIPKQIRLTQDGADSWHHSFTVNYANSHMYSFPVVDDYTTLVVTGVVNLTGHWIVSWCDGRFNCSIDPNECVPVRWDRDLDDWVPE